MSINKPIRYHRTTTFAYRMMDWQASPCNHFQTASKSRSSNKLPNLRALQALCGKCGMNGDHWYNFGRQWHWWSIPRDYNMEGRKSISFIQPLTSARHPRQWTTRVEIMNDTTSKRWEARYSTCEKTWHYLSKCWELHWYEHDYMGSNQWWDVDYVRGCRQNSGLIIVSNRLTA